MIKKYVCKDGTVYANADEWMVDVDELIEFLEPFRGKKFYNGAVENLGFRVNAEQIWCDEMDYILGKIDDEELCEEIYDALEV